MMEIRPTERNASPGEARSIPSAKAAPEGVTPFGAVMSSVQWSDGERGGARPRLAADEMFEPRTNAATRRMNALRGNARLDALREPSRTQTQQKSPASSEVVTPVDQDPALSNAGALIGNAPPVTPTEPQSLSSPAPKASAGPAAKFDEAAQSTPALSSAGKNGQETSIGDAVDAPSVALASTPIVQSNQMNSGVADSGSIARQIGRLVAEPRSAVATATKNEPSLGLARNDAQLKDARVTKGVPGEKSAESPADPAAEWPPDEATPSRFADLIRAIHVRSGDKHSSARLQLQPPRLGYMEVDVRMEGDQVRIEVRTETDEARRQVHEQAAQLKTALEAAGIEVQQLNVSVDPDWLKHRESGAPPWMHGSPHEQPTEGARRSVAPRSRDRITGEARFDFDQLEGLELADVTWSSFDRASRRIDLRV